MEPIAWGWYAGLMPIFAHLAILVLCYLMARTMDQWWLWYLVWGFAALSALAYLVGRLHNLSITYDQTEPFDVMRVISANVGAYAFLAQLVAAYLIFRRGRRHRGPSEG